MAPNFRNLCFLAFLLGISATAVAQTKSSHPPSAEDRRAELAQITPMLTDPDQNVRIANMEGILQSGDNTKIQMASRIALSGEDKDLKALALRNYMATTKDFMFDIQLPEDLRSEFERIRNDQGKVAAFRGNDMLLNLALGSNLIIHMVLWQYHPKDTVGTWAQPGRDWSSQFSIKGDQLRSDMGYIIGADNYGCSVSGAFRPCRQS